jgi:hypothetical protein
MCRATNEFTFLEILPIRLAHHGKSVARSGGNHPVAHAVDRSGEQRGTPRTRTRCYADQTDLLKEIQQTRPLSVVMSEKVTEIREWAADRTVPCD